MKIFKGFDDIDHIPNPVLTIGTFDGVHLGHQKIINQVNEIARKIGGESVLFTFYPHPRMVLFPESHGVKLIETQEEKLAKLKRIGLQNIIVYPFTPEFSRISAIEFVRDFLVTKLKVKTIVVGYDHHFGKNREGDIELLKELSTVYDFDVIEISAEEIDEVNISSTKIRNALMEGEVDLANTYLGEEFEINGKVVHGEKLGTKLGFPTANIDIENDVKILPKNGIYAVRVVRENGTSHFGLLNIGSRPTVSDSEIITIEVNLLDFKGDLYGDYLTLKLLKRIRDEKKFNTLEELKEKMKEDEEILRTWINDFNW